MADLIEELVEAGVHYGHQSRKWNPKMKPFLLQKRSGVHIINVEETALRLEEASEFLSKVVLEGGKLLFVGCKRQAQEAAACTAQVGSSPRKRFSAGSGAARGGAAARRAW